MKAFLPVLFLLAAGVLALVLAGCTTALSAGTREEAVDRTAPPAARPTIPEIDTRAPADVETATFALG